MQIENFTGTSTTKTVIIVAGATGVGKTAVAIELAQFFKTEIISADSRQCYNELNIGVARPSYAELEKIPHHFIASHSVHDSVDAAVFEQYALLKAEELFKRHDVVIVAGGTGLYIKTFCEGMDIIPPVKPGIREQILQQFNAHGTDWLQHELQVKDPAFYKVGEMQNPQRMMRALEVIESTGHSIIYFRQGKKEKRDFKIIKTALELPKEELHRNINSRVDQMIEAGLVAEVKNLHPLKQLNALQTVGYREIFDYLENKMPLDTAIERIKTNTRHYAKRQMTWFRKDVEMKWFSPADTARIIRLLTDQQ